MSFYTTTKSTLRKAPKTKGLRAVCLAQLQKKQTVECGGDPLKLLSDFQMVGFNKESLRLQTNFKTDCFAKEPLTVSTNFKTVESDEHPL